MIGQLKPKMDETFYSTKGRITSPKNTDLQQELVKSFHDHETAGHPGKIGTYNAVQQHYWWPGLHTFVKN